MEKRKFKRRFGRACTAFLAGVLNGFLGTGGGVPLYFSLSKEGADQRAYATASVGVLLLSFLTVFLYRGDAVSPDTVTPFLPFLAVLGGATGALLLGRVRPFLLRFIFGLLLLLSGGYAIGKEIYLALA